MTRLRLWLARFILRDLPYVVMDQDSFELYLSMMQAQRDFYRLIDRHPQFKTTAATLLSDRSTRLM